MKPTDELYFQYAGVITSVVNKYAHDFPDLADDLFLQAQLLFCQACLSYDPERNVGKNGKIASFETWLRNKLKSLNMVIRKASKGPCSDRHLGNPPAICFSEIERAASTADKTSKKTDYTDTDQPYAIPMNVLQEYTEKLSDGTDKGHDYPEALLPYIRALRGDALQVFKDYCLGAFERKERKNYIPIALQKARAIYDPRYIYRAVYRDRGWSYARVQNAWRGLHGILKNYLDGKLPTNVNNSSTRKRLRVPRNEAYWHKWEYDFEQKHSITYNTYRVLVKKGLLPPLQECNETEDFSRFLLQMFSY